MLARGYEIRGAIFCGILGAYHRWWQEERLASGPELSRWYELRGYESKEEWDANATTAVCPSKLGLHQSGRLSTGHLLVDAVLCASFHL